MGLIFGFVLAIAFAILQFFLSFLPIIVIVLGTILFNVLGDALSASRRKETPKDEVTEALERLLSHGPSQTDSYVQYRQADSSESEGGFSRLGDAIIDWERDTRRQRNFHFVDGDGRYRSWGESFVDGDGRYREWGESFVDGDGRYREWGEGFVDGDGRYREWGEGCSWSSAFRESGHHDLVKSGF